MKANLRSSQKQRLQQALFGLFGSKQPRPLPFFLNERVLRDIGVLEPKAPAHRPANTDAFPGPAVRQHVFSIGLTGL